MSETVSLEHDIEYISVSAFAFWHAATRLLAYALMIAGIGLLVVLTIISPLNSLTTIGDLRFVVLADCFVFMSFAVASRNRIGVAAASLVATATLVLPSAVSLPYLVIPLAMGLLSVIAVSQLRRERRRVLAYTNADLGAPVRLELNRRSRDGHLASIFGSKLLLLLALVSAMAGIMFAVTSAATITAIYVLFALTWSRKFYRRARGRSAIAFEELREYDPRAPIVILRAFRDDKVLANDQAVEKRSRDPRDVSTYEEALLGQLAAQGPVVTFGDPAVSTDPLGASRYRVDPNADWRQIVADFLHSAALVVVVAAKTDGLKWEISLLREHGLLSKTVFVVPHARRLTPNQRAKRITHVLALVDETADIDLRALRDAIAFRVEATVRIFTTRLLPATTTSALLSTRTDADSTGAAKLRLATLLNTELAVGTVAAYLILTVLATLSISGVGLIGGYVPAGTHSLMYVAALIPFVNTAHQVLIVGLIICWLVSLQGRYNLDRGSWYYAIRQLGTSMAPAALIALLAVVVSVFCRADILTAIAWYANTQSGHSLAAVVFGGAFWMCIAWGVFRFVNALSVSLKSRFVVSLVSLMFASAVAIFVIFAFGPTMVSIIERPDHLPLSPLVRSSDSEAPSKAEFPKQLCREFDEGDGARAEKWAQLLSEFGARRAASIASDGNVSWEVCTDRPVLLWTLLGADLGLSIYDW